MIGSAPFGHGPVASAPAPQSLHATPGSVGARKAHAPGPAPAPRLCPPAAAASSTAPGPSVPAPPAPTATRPLLVIDVTGRTGRRALEGLLAAGVPPTDISLLSSRPASAAHADLLARGMEVVGADLDSEGSLQAALGGRGGAVYIHALSADAASADPAELERARQLGAALAAAGASHVVYNSSAGRSCGAGISQMDQKHQVEDILAAAGLPLTCLQASLFMEELWKRYTRPAILKGTFAFAMPPDKPLHLVSVKDMGRVAAQVVAAPDEFVGRAVPLAGDALTPVQLAAAFSAAQRHAPPVAYKHLPAWPFWLLNRDLYRICRFYSTQGYGIDAEACRARFGLQSFAEFLEETSWGDASIPPLS